VKKEVKYTHTQTIYMAWKSTHESRHITTPEPIHGHQRNKEKTL